MDFFDNDVQQLKHDVLREIAKLAFDNELTAENILDLASVIIPEGAERMRCCIYKERAIVGERVKLALGGDAQKTNMVEVLKIACDECPVEGIHITQSCRGCIAHKCANSCPKDAITFVNRKAEIVKSKCIECGRCVSHCSYGAIVKQTRPCVNACKVNALSIDKDTKKAVIKDDKCISCGACVYHCPFGAIMDKSYITQAIRMIRESDHNKIYKIYAVVAPSLVSQYANVPEITTGKAVTAIKQIGFHSVIEAALGADMVASMEAEELAEKGFLTSSCCPAFVSYIEKNYPALNHHVSHNLSPMAQISKVIKQMDPTGKVIFIGPCIAKKAERQNEAVKDYVDCVLTFEEMQAMFSAKDIELEALPETPLDNASYFGRIFAHSGGLATAVEHALKEHGITQEQFDYKPISCNGISECKSALLKANKGVLSENFIEGMICEGGCIGGPACLSHSSKDKKLVGDYGHLAIEKTIADAISIFDENAL
ncbi:4Fe-4S dicluster domain-containing protein [Anoxybacterium hadale]|uniref:4Fe-4S dicluster domain-containing protein n=1 Tax=Anoxybacterium hadale TaxID=3408580 RepID=A0ACD1AB03_9FIRM|nr:4Fe-4S dicluster domain-containing protein [Clostridiales bacterium]